MRNLSMPADPGRTVIGGGVPGRATMTNASSGRPNIKREHRVAMVKAETGEPPGERPQAAQTLADGDLVDEPAGTRSRRATHRERVPVRRVARTRVSGDRRHSKYAK